MSSVHGSLKFIEFNFLNQFYIENLMHLFHLFYCYWQNKHHYWIQFIPNNINHSKWYKWRWMESSNNVCWKQMLLWTIQSVCFCDFIRHKIDLYWHKEKIKRNSATVWTIMRMFSNFKHGLYINVLQLIVPVACVSRKFNFFSPIFYINPFHCLVQYIWNSFWIEIYAANTIPIVNAICHLIKV